MHNFTIQGQTDVVLNELRTRQASQTFQFSLFIHKFWKKDQRVRKSFKITFVDRQ